MDFNPGQEHEALLRENLRLTRENNKLLKRMHRAHVIDVWFRVLFLLIAVGAPIFLYQYYLEDYVKNAWTTYKELKEDINNVSNLFP